MGDAADHADLAQRRVVQAARVGIAPAHRRLAGGAGLQRHQGQFGAQPGDDLVGGQNLVHAPAVGRAHIHVFDEAQGHARALEVARHGQDLVFIGAALDHHVDLDVGQARGLGRLDAGQHVGDREVHVVHAAEHRVVQPVQAHGDAVQARVLERAGLAGQQGAVGGQRQVQRLAAGRAQGGELLHQRFHVLAQQRLAARQPDLLHAVLHEQACRARDFLETQQRAVRQVAVVLVEDFLGHAVAAAEVAAVGDADAQVAQRPAKPVLQIAGGRLQQTWHGGRARGGALVDQGDHSFCHACDFARMPMSRHCASLQFLICV